MAYVCLYLRAVVASLCRFPSAFMNSAKIESRSKIQIQVLSVNVKCQMLTNVGVYS